MSEPEPLAKALASRPRPLLLSLDVDGTLAPIVARPADAALLPGTLEAVLALAGVPGVQVVAVSGRPLRELTDQFGFPAGLRLVGSHGLEDSALPDVPLTGEERERLADARAAAQDTALRAPGAWVEDKPLSVVLHVRHTSDADGEAAVDAFARAAAGLGLYTMTGKRVLEVGVRPMSKASAIDRLRAEADAATVAHIGDDASDEAVFESLGPDDVAVKVGEGPSVAAERLARPDDVLVLLRTLATLL